MAKKQITLKTPEQLKAIGAELAQAFVTSETQASTTKREALLKCAVEATDKETASVILAAYTAELQAAKSFKDNIIRVRKAEANTVFKAVQANAKNLAKLQKSHGNYNDFIALARSLVPVKDKANKPRKTDTETTKVIAERRTPVLSDKAVQTVEVALTKASPMQLSDIVDTAGIQLQKIAPPKLASHQTLVLINSLAHAIANNTYAEDFEKEVAQQIIVISQSAVDKLAQVAQDTVTALENLPKQSKAVEVETPEVTES
jgi:hypothetical protein